MKKQNYDDDDEEETIKGEEELDEDVNEDIVEEPLAKRTRIAPAKNKKQ
jgi:hypothetical protein